jgi:hypothetical protein
VYIQQEEAYIQQEEVYIQQEYVVVVIAATKVVRRVDTRAGAHL